MEGVLSVTGTGRIAFAAEATHNGSDDPDRVFGLAGLLEWVAEAADPGAGNEQHLCADAFGGGGGRRCWGSR